VADKSAEAENRHAARRQADGESVASIARSFGVDHMTVARELRKAETSARLFR
jgi:IS30 family transposase